MKTRQFIFIVAVLCLSKYVITARKMKYHTFKPDIIISPCGVFGLYNLGVCNYIKNHFDIKNKKISGLSSGSFNAIFLCLDSKYDKKFMRKCFETSHYYNKDGILKYAEKIMEGIQNHIKIDNIHKENLYIGLSHPNELVFYNDFNTMEQIMNCCMGSSFIPGLTHKNLFYFYEQRYTLDGAVWYRYYKKYIDVDKTLIISPRMFKRYEKKFLIYESLFNRNISLYDLYLKGYNDARNNHDYFKQYLTEKTSHSSS